MTKLEEVARAICAASLPFKGMSPLTDEEWTQLWADPKQREMSSAIARAAIAAMRSPDAIMISAGDAEVPFSRGTETHRMSGGITPEGIWEAMINAAICDHNWQENTEDEDVCAKCDASRHIPCGREGRR